MKELHEKLLIWLAWRLPKGLAKWVAIRVMTFDSEGNPGERTAAESLDAWATNG